jgi:hypothetical protein
MTSPASHCTVAVIAVRCYSTMNEWPYRDHDHDHGLRFDSEVASHNAADAFALVAKLGVGW